MRNILNLRCSLRLLVVGCLPGPRRGFGGERLERNLQLMLFITSVNPAKPTGNNVYLFAV